MPSPIRPCKYCGVVVPQFSVGEVAFAAIVRALTNGSKTLAAAELKYYVGCSDHESLVWVEHLRSCLGAWPTASTDEAVIQNITEAFSGIEKPEHFTNFTHCDECKEHDDTLRARTVETLQGQQRGQVLQSSIREKLRKCVIARPDPSPLKVLKRRCYGITNLTHLYQRVCLDLNGYARFGVEPL